MIIDVHGHYTTEPGALQVFRAAQLNGENPASSALWNEIGDDEVRESVESNQVRILTGRGGDLMLFSPRASGMQHHWHDPHVANEWARASNDLVYRVSTQWKSVV